MIEKVSDFSKTTCVSFSKIQEFQNLFFPKFKQRERIRIIVAKNALLRTYARTNALSREGGRIDHRTDKFMHHREPHGAMREQQEQNRDVAYNLSWQAEQALHAWSDMDDAVLLGLLDEQVPMDRIGETLMRSRASLAERVLVLIEEGFLGVEVLM